MINLINILVRVLTGLILLVHYRGVIIREVENKRCSNYVRVLC